MVSFLFRFSLSAVRLSLAHEYQAADSSLAFGSIADFSTDFDLRSRMYDGPIKPTGLALEDDIAGQSASRKLPALYLEQFAPVNGQSRDVGPTISSKELARKVRTASRFPETDTSLALFPHPSGFDCPSLSFRSFRVLARR